MPKIAVCSDLHLEVGDINIQNTEDSDILVLAGDIMLANDLHDHPDTPYTPEIIKILGSRQRAAQSYRDFLKRCSFQFPHVIIIAGNHEFYHGRWIQGLETLRKECAAFQNIHFLERDLVDIAGVTFVGGTLWTDMNRNDSLTLHAVKDMMNDYRVIRHDGLGYIKLRPAHTVSRHRDTLEYFKLVIDERKDSKIVVVSHMAPSAQSVHLKYKNAQLVNGAYYSDLSEFILDRPQIQLWIHGHTHHNFDYTIGTTRVVCNPRGYVGYERGTQEQDPYYPMIIDLDIDDKK